MDKKVVRLNGKFDALSDGTFDDDKRVQYEEVISGLKRCANKSDVNFSARISAEGVEHGSSNGIVRMDFDVPCDLPPLARNALVHAIVYADEVWFSQPYGADQLGIACAVRDMRKRPQQMGE